MCLGCDWLDARPDQPLHTNDGRVAMSLVFQPRKRVEKESLPPIAGGEVYDIEL